MASFWENLDNGLSVFRDIKVAEAQADAAKHAAKAREPKPEKAVEPSTTRQESGVQPQSGINKNLLYIGGGIAALVAIILVTR